MISKDTGRTKILVFEESVLKKNGELTTIDTNKKEMPEITYRLQTGQLFPLLHRASGYTVVNLGSQGLIYI